MSQATWIEVLTSAVQMAATGVIAVFAVLTWRATKLYARVAGLSLFAEAVLKGTAAERNSKLYGDLLALLKTDFPEEAKALEQHMPARAKSTDKV